MDQPIQGKVAKILSSREIVLNIGIEHGVDLGMSFDVMAASESDIVDPDTNEVLGSIRRPRVRVKVTHIQSKISVASTFQSKRVNLGGSGLFLNPALRFGPIARSLMPPSWVSEYETLRKTEKTPETFNEKDSKVKVGDPVVQVTASSQED